MGAWGGAAYDRCIVRDVGRRRLFGVVHDDFCGAEAFQNALTYCLCMIDMRKLW